MTWAVRAPRGALVVAWLLLACTSSAHEIRPAFLDVHEDLPGELTLLWKTPMVGDARLALDVELPAAARDLTPRTTRAVPGAAIQTWAVRTEDLRGREIRIRGLEATMTDALVRVAFADGSTFTQRLTPSSPAVRIPDRQSSAGVARVYVQLGVEHILRGTDHLLFVLGLLLLVADRWMLVRTVTAFTVAHSITLAAAALGYVSPRIGPIEAAIALSILFLGPEILRAWQGGTSLTIRRPWLVSFVFGLLHGFGFSTALTTAGLPRVDLPLALLCFNVGVELGQLAFVAVVLAAERALRRLAVQWPTWLARLPAYAVGTMGAFWTIQRTFALLAAPR